MVDLQSRYRIYPLGYTPPEVRESVTSYANLYRDNAPHLFNSGQIRNHECSSEPMKELTASSLWEAQLLSHGLRQTYDSISGLHTRPAPEPGRQPPEKLLYDAGVRGSGDGNFLFPRAVAVTFSGDVIVADTNNHRIQVFNQTGLFVRKFDGTAVKADGKSTKRDRSLAKSNGEVAKNLKSLNGTRMESPNSVCVMFNDDVVVTEPKPKLVGIYRQDGVRKLSFSTIDEPCCVICDDNYNIYVGTTAKTVEVYTRKGIFTRSFKTTSKKSPKYPIFVCVNDDDELIVCDTKTCYIKFFTLEGTQKAHFHLESPTEGLTVQPSSMCLDAAGQILVSDSLNHTVNLYTTKGEIIRSVLGPTDGLGSVQSICVSSEGHLIVTECSVNGDHTLKIFRFTDCLCHFWRPGSSKRSSADIFHTRLDFL